MPAGSTRRPAAIAGAPASRVGAAGVSPFSDRQEAEIQRVLRRISEDSGVWFSVYVGRPGDDEPEGFANRAHAAIGGDVAGHACLVAVFPNERRVEIVYGVDVRNRLTDRDCALAALTMTSSFVGGDLVGGIVSGLEMLGERARTVRHARS